VPIFAATAGRRESGAPEYTFGGRIQGQLGPVEIGLQAKRTGPRFVNDVNQPIVLCSAAFVNVNNCLATPINAYGARAPAFTLVDVDVRVPLGFAGFNDETYFQFNVTNLFDEFYVGNFGGALLGTTAPFVQLGAPRAYIATLVVGFR
jgi:iron complex outermembrane receptor protein